MTTDLRTDGGPTVAIGVDVGGSGIKVGVVDVAKGELISPRLRVATPTPSTPAKIVTSIARTVARAAKAAGGVPSSVPVGVGVPSVVINGVTRSAANIDPGWIDFDAGRALATALKRPVTVLNDADAAGLAEMRFGAGAGEPGVVFVLTLGTGVGSGLFNDGVLVPNTELGHMEIRGRDAERRSAAAARTRRGLSWKAWATGPRRASRRDRQAVLAEPHHSRRWREQAAREVHPKAHDPAAGRPGQAPQRRGDRRRRDGRRGAHHHRLRRVAAGG